MTNETQQHEAVNGSVVTDESSEVESAEVESVDAESADSESAEATGPAGGTRGGRKSGAGVRQLEEEGEVAADYLEELLDIADLDGDIDIDVENGRASVAIVSESGSRSLRRLVGPKGDVLEALQELTRLAVQASTGERSRLMLDIAGFREGRRKAVSEAAAAAIDEAKSSGEAVRMDPMSAFERKIVHDVVAAAGLDSESEGVDPNRRVVIRASGGASS